MGQTNAAASNLAMALAANGPLALRGAYSTPADTVPGTPWAIVGAPKGNITPGSWEIIEYTFPVDFLIARSSSEARDQATINDALDNLLAALRSGISLSGAVAYALPGGFDTNVFYTVGSETYQSVRIEITMLIASGQSYTT